MNPNREQLAMLPREEIESLQLAKLNALLADVTARPFYRDRLDGITTPLDSLDQLRAIPILEKSDLIAAAPGAAAMIFDLPRRQYVRLHQTSGTKGFPLTVLDSPQDWTWWLDCWDYVLDAAHVTDEDVAMMAFSFGPFIGFWTANDALLRRGALVVPGGGVSSENRLQMIIDHRCTVVCCTPTYALHLAAVAEQTGIDLAASSVSRVIVAGEPGGSVPIVRERIEHSWGARVIDHTGASELGAWGFGSDDGMGIHVIESEFIVELLRFDEQNPGGIPVDDGDEAELVLTNLGRYGGAAIRYRTGDIVRGYRQHEQPCKFVWLKGGVLGRSDDMMVIRGVNIFPSSIEAIVREVDSAAEFRIIATRSGEMDQLSLEFEGNESSSQRLAKLLRDRLAMRIDVKALPPGSLPRFEGKSKRMIDHRNSGPSTESTINKGSS